MTIEVKIAASSVDAIYAFKAYVAMFAEGLVPGEIDAEKTLTNVIRFMNGPDSLILLAMDGEKCAGVLTLVTVSLWYSTVSRAIEDKGLYVVEPYRDGEAFKLLLQDAKNVSDDLGYPVFITIINAKRKRGGRSGFERIGATLGYENRGAVLCYTPQEAERETAKAA